MYQARLLTYHRRKAPYLGHLLRAPSQMLLRGRRIRIQTQSVCFLAILAACD